MAKNILAISNHAQMLGGGEHSFLDLLRHLPYAIHPVAVVPSEGELSSRLIKSDIDTRIVPLAAIRSGRPNGVIFTLRKMVQLCRSERPSLIYANGSRAALYAGVTGRTLGVPVVWHCRIADKDPSMDSVLAALSSRIVVNSKATAARFSSFGKHKVVVVYNGISTAELETKHAFLPEWLKPEYKIILVPARVSRWKGHDIALRVFERLAAGHPLVHLVCAGGPDPCDQDWGHLLQERSSDSKYSNRIHWLGHVDDMLQWYKISYVLLLPSINEPFGRVLVEGMACGIPVVAFRSGGIPEIVRGGREGLLIEPDDEDGMVDAVNKILVDDEMHRKMAEAGRERARDFDLAAHVRRMVSVFEAHMSRQI